jgi:UDP-GlcNAc:undecaprenyl-phosphate/decaprenyl-phosphate GlcNAc-1-phosphate transferase
MIRLGVGVAVTAALSLIFTSLVRHCAHQLGIVAVPRRDRWHSRPTALMGGIAIYLAFVIGCFIFAPDLSRAYPILIAATVLFGVGIVDDIRQLKPYVKLVMQVVAASIVVFGGLRLPGMIWTSWGADFLTIFWLVAITNAINLLDNMDGLAGGISLIACAFLAITFLVNGHTTEAALPLILAGAIAGFLRFNFNPASIFMGDCGSMFLGFALSGIALLSDFGRARNLVSVLATPVLILTIPIFDTLVVAVTRKLSGRPVSQGGRDHTSHRLVALGMSERRATLLLYLFAALSGALALAVRQMAIWGALALIVGFALSVLFIGLYVGKVGVYEKPSGSAGIPACEVPGNSQLTEAGRQGCLRSQGFEAVSGTLVDPFGNFSHRRRIVEILLDTVLVALAYYSAYLLRFDGDMPGEQIAIFIRTLPPLVAIQILSFLIGGVYKGIWRYAGVGELARLAVAVFIGSTICGLAVLFFYKFHGPSRAVFILNGVLLFVFVGASRVSFRLIAALIAGQIQPAPDARPVLIYGAGDRGEILIRELLNNPAYSYQPVGFIDDDARKTGRLLRGYRIFSSDDLPGLISSHGVSEVLVSSLKVPESRLDGLRNMGVGLKRLKIDLEGMEFKSRI